MKSLIGAKMQRFEEEEIQEMMREEITRYKKEEHNMKNQIVKNAALKALVVAAVLGAAVQGMSGLAFAVGDNEAQFGNPTRPKPPVIPGAKKDPVTVPVSTTQTFGQPGQPKEPKANPNSDRVQPNGFTIRGYVDLDGSGVLLKLIVGPNGGHYFQDPRTGAVFGMVNGRRVIVGIRAAYNPLTNRMETL